MKRVSPKRNQNVSYFQSQPKNNMYKQMQYMNNRNGNLSQNGNMNQAFYQTPTKVKGGGNFSHTPTLIEMVNSPNRGPRGNTPNRPLYLRNSPQMNHMNNHQIGMMNNGANQPSNNQMVMMNNNEMNSNRNMMGNGHRTPNINMNMQNVDSSSSSSSPNENKNTEQVKSKPSPSDNNPKKKEEKEKDDRNKIKIQNYKKGKMLGEGASGRVYISMDQNSGFFFALKEINFENCPPDDLDEKLKSIQEEINVMKILRHQNIVNYLGAKKYGLKLHIFLEYVPGGSLEKIISSYGNLVEPVVRSYTRQVLLGLEYLHENNVIHRDIKGANILVCVDGTIKLADFGCSKEIKELKRFVTLIGTPNYMAPEVIKQAGHGKSADIWSVGCTVLEMLSGQPPFHEYKTAVAVMYHIASTNDLPEFPSDLSEDGIDFLNQCFNRNPEKRPNATQLLKHKWLQGIEDTNKQEDATEEEDKGGKVEEEVESEFSTNDNNQMMQQQPLNQHLFGGNGFGANTMAGNNNEGVLDGSPKRGKIYPQRTQTPPGITPLTGTPVHQNSGMANGRGPYENQHSPHRRNERSMEQSRNYNPMMEPAMEQGGGGGRPIGNGGKNQNFNGNPYYGQQQQQQLYDGYGNVVQNTMVLYDQYGYPVVVPQNHQQQAYINNYPQPQQLDPLGSMVNGVSEGMNDINKKGGKKKGGGKRKSKSKHRKHKEKHEQFLLGGGDPKKRMNTGCKSPISSKKLKERAKSQGGVRRGRTSSGRPKSKIARSPKSGEGKRHPSSAQKKSSRKDPGNMLQISSLALQSDPRRSLKIKDNTMKTILNSQESGNSGINKMEVLGNDGQKSPVGAIRFKTRQGRSHSVGPTSDSQRAVSRNNKRRRKRTSSQIRGIKKAESPNNNPSDDPNNNT